MNVHALLGMLMQVMQCMWFRERGHRLGKPDLPGNAASVRFFTYALSSVPVQLLYNGNAAVRWGPAAGAP
jgi:hypothetical protein